ncbi:MAG: hypothetical protein AAF667_13350 [Pseudomonadota bacterium]
MAQYVGREIPLDWMGEVNQVVLIRQLARVVASYAAMRKHPTADDPRYAGPAALRIM